MSALQNEMMQTKEKFKSNEDKVYHLLRQQESMAEKWRTEHHNSIRYFEKIIVDLNSQIKMLKKEYDNRFYADRNVGLTTQLPAKGTVPPAKKDATANF